MEKVDFKKVDLAHEYDAIDGLSFKDVFIKAKCIFESPKVKTNWDYVNALFSMADSTAELMLGLMFMDEFPDGERYKKYRVLNNIKTALGGKPNKEYKVYFSKDNAYGWIDNTTFQPNLRVHRYLMLRMVHELFRKNGNVSLMMVLENLQTTQYRTHSNWETMAMLVMIWDDICNILGLESSTDKGHNPFIHNVSLN